MVIPEWATPFFTGTNLRRGTTTGPVPADSRQGTSSVRNIAWPYKLGTDPIAVGGINKWTPTWKKAGGTA